MTKECKTRSAIDLVWRNMPQGQSTSSDCPTKGCNGAGRGGGRCIKCAEKELTKLTHKAIARKYIKAVQLVRDIEEAMISGNNQLVSKGHRPLVTGRFGSRKELMRNVHRLSDHGFTIEENANECGISISTAQKILKG